MAKGLAAIGDVVVFLAKFTAMETTCGALSFGADVRGYSQDAADLALFELAKQVEFKPDGRAAAHLDHFLNGGGESLTFDTALLLNEVQGVRDRVANTVSAGIAMGTVPQRRMSGTQSGLKIDVGQDCYDATPIGQDWKNALGSFVFDWTFASCSAGGARSIIEVSGRNLYRWHPTVMRWTQCLHEAGDRLTRSGAGAQNFWMIAKPCLVSIHSWRPVG